MKRQVITQSQPQPQHKVYSDSALRPTSTLLNLTTKLRYISLKYYYNLGQYTNLTACSKSS